VPTSGTIHINDVDINEISLQGLRQMISYTSQSPTLLPDTLINNVCYGETISEDRTRHALSQAQLTLFSRKLPEGIHTKLKSNVKDACSGGEQQRLSLARGFMTDKPVIILDEATSALDSVTEENILQNIETANPASTIIMVSHNIKNIVSADHIIVLKDGQVEMVGTHEQLLESSPTYQQIYRAALHEKSHDTVNEYRP
jgi:ABC-type multidrug transport system fused ATPase/permease subunit